jgi:tetratricopeptide (TPR) repeat protein
MAEADLFPSYIPREEEREILTVLERVRQERQSQVVLLYGEGGVGKTRLLRTLARRQGTEGQLGRASWVEPIDVDDPEYWLLANLQGAIARRLDPDGQYFGEYLRYLAQLVAFSGESVSAETIVSRLGHVRRIFLECYADFISGTGKPAVIGLDTVETIRGTELLVTLTQWMKSLPGTLFILSGRPVPGTGQGLAADPIEMELAHSHRPMPVTRVRLAKFTLAAAEQYLTESKVGAGLAAEERVKLVRLTRGHPLWLALTVAYLDDKGLPEEARLPLAEIERIVPYAGALPRDGERLEEEFKRRILSPYRSSGFWPEAVKRLAVVRRGVNESMWSELMGDRLPDGLAAGASEWQRLLATPWIRPRANLRFVTLHDALAEELARRVITVNDGDLQWRRGLWQRAMKIYDGQAEAEEQRFKAEAQRLDRRRQLTGGPAVSSAAGALTGQRGPLITDASRLVARKREVDLLKVSGLEYQLLCDFAAGSQRFLDLIRQARRDQDLMFQELLANWMQRYLPVSDPPGVLDDAVGGVILDYRAWLASTAQHGTHREIGAEIGEYLVASGQGGPARELLASLPLSGAGARQLVRHNRLLGNAYLRVPGQVTDGLRYLEAALAAAEGAAELEEADRYRLVAEAYRALGFYYRNIGKSGDADRAYRLARDAMSVTLRQRKSGEDRSMMASIQSNWAYVKGFAGLHAEGLSLVDSAIAVREKLGETLEAGLSYSTRGEVLRFQQQYKRAWESYAQAEAIFGELHNASWLGIIYQEQAICLYQAHRYGVDLTSAADPLAEAKELAVKAIEICEERSVRGYPSALNRAGRIVGYIDADEGLTYLALGVDAARELLDGWYWLANIVEYAELSYRAFTKAADAGRRADYRGGMDRYRQDMAEAMTEYEFMDLIGRWEIVQAHLSVHDLGETGDLALLAQALRGYTDGFARIAELGYVGSYGTSVISDALCIFRDLFRQLPDSDQEQWLEHLRLAWTGSEPGSTMLLAWLEQLY